MPNDDTNTGEQEVKQVTEETKEQAEAKPAETEAPKAEQEAKATTIAGGVEAEKPEPDKPIEYDFSESLPEGWQADEQAAQEFSAIANELHLDNEQANKLASYGYAFASKLMEAQAQARVLQSEEWAKETVEKLGADLDKHRSLCGVAMEKLEATYPGIRQVLNESGVGNSYPVVMAFSKLGELLSEDNGKIIGVKGEAKASHDWYPNSHKK